MQVGGAVGRPGNGGVVIAVDVWVVDADEFDGSAAGLDRGAGVVEVDPARAGEHVAQLLDRQRNALDVLAVAVEVPERVLHERPAVVVGAEHESAGAVQQRGERPHDSR